MSLSSPEYVVIRRRNNFHSSNFECFNFFMNKFSESEPEAASRVTRAISKEESCGSEF